MDTGNIRDLEGKDDKMQQKWENGADIKTDETDVGSSG